jgi:hypothetical protein
MKKRYRKLLHVFHVKYITAVLCGLYLTACDRSGPSTNRKEALRQEQEEECIRQEKTAAQQEVERQEFVEDFVSKVSEEQEKAALQAFLEQAQAVLLDTQSQEIRWNEREYVLFINTGPGVFEPSEICYRQDVYSYNCLTREIVFRDGTSGHYPEALRDRDEK